MGLQAEAARIPLADGTLYPIAVAEDDAVGRVGLPHYDAIPGGDPSFFKNMTVGGGPAPVRAFIDELLPDVLEGRIQPGRVFDCTASLAAAPDGYRAMNERKSIKVMITP